MNQTKLNLVVFRSISITFSFYFFLMINTNSYLYSQNEMRRRFFLRPMNILKHRRLKRILSRMFPNKKVLIVDNKDGSQTISIL